MMAKFIIIIYSLCLVGVCVTQIVQNGQCDPSIELVDSFDLSQFIGTWYEIQRTASPEQNGACAQFDFTPSTGNTVNVHHRGVNRNWQEESRGTAALTSGTAQMVLNIDMFTGHQRSSSKNGQLKMEGEAKDFWVLLTNYVNFSVIYSCENISPTQRSIYLWVLGRDREHPNEMIPGLISTQLNSLIGISLNDLSTIDHSDVACYVLPVIEEGQPIILPGQCDTTIPVVQAFNVTEFTGTWHQISSYYSESSTGNCARAEYSLGDGVVNVRNSHVIDQALLTISGTATVASDDGSAKLRVTLDVSGENIEQDLWVLATDYHNYAISYTCVNVNESQQLIYSWILGRTRQLTPTSQIEVNRVIDSNLVLNSEYYAPTDQTDSSCFYYPEPSDEPVIFRGQCDLSLPVMTDFDAAAYTGLWHSVEQYPAGNQTGSCSNAFYTLNPTGVVDVLNSEVIDQTLSTATATAVLVSEDGSAKLEVTFPIPGTGLFVTTDYWVMGTDYTSYALVYSCTNIGDDYRRVASWKLSRTKSLTPAANTAINQIVNQINVLDNMYYQDMDQSTEACFFYPTPQAGVPVIFPGQCDTTIGLPVFNLSQFEGTWYETEAYPKEEQSGQCISHAYTVAGTNQLNLVSSSVTDQFLALTTGTLNSTDSSGRLTITINSESGGVITIPFWIVATDYTNYALAYACVNTVVNDNPDFRAVWSWKLSRERQQSPAGNIAINNAIATIDVLEQRYYNNVDQSDDACFYLPEIAPGQPIILPGQCDQNIPVVQNFDVANFTGTWNQINSYFSESSTGTCAKAEYSLGDGVVNVRNSHIIDQTLLTISGTATVASDDASAKLEVILNVGGINITQDLWILATDYNNYAISYTCENLVNNQQRVYSWILSRTRQLSPASQEQVNQVVNSIRVLNNRYYTPTDQSANGCFFYPEPSDEPVIFRGQCDLSLPVMTDFDAAAYTGLWHSVEQYPAGNQTGSCSNAFYTLNPTGVVDVLNSEVIDQTLSTATATAVLVSDDGSAKLEVTFPIPGTGLFVTTDYWVMGTDYTSYALVYSCTNIGDDYRRVASWKLSRTKSLTPAANTAINQIVNQINVLDNRYYQEMDQSTEACFFYPTPQAGVPVIFPGQCDTTIGLPVFNLSQFEGTWYETEAYPKEEQSGQCISHAYTVAGTNQLNLVSSSVTDQFLALTTGTLNSTDSSGRLTITINSESGGVITIPFWIVATDYSNYALAYACVNTVVNDNPDFRAVWSWKLSRERQQSPAGNIAINNAIATIDVLDQRYYNNVDQSDDACFYLPEIAPGQPIILPGQCDQNIPVVQNFDVANFTGTWNQINSYFSESSTGTCARAEYSLGDGVVNVRNSHIIGQTLLTISGTATVASDDASAKLEVILNVGGINITQDLWILATDYDNYAISYTCENLVNNQQRVYSWILSRTRQLSPASQEQVNQVVNSIRVLNNRYYTPTDQSANGCFFYPEPSDEPVIFRGQCDLSLPVMTDFDAAAYTGLWHSVEQYPAGNQTGSCSNAFYTLNPTGVVDVLNSEVIDQTLSTATATAVLVSDDGSAKLEVTFPIPGTGLFVTTDYWVMGTDYTSYALVYSCTNVDDDNMRVASWKLSRTKSLTPAANTAINQIVNQINVLDNRYYQDMDQSAEACFFYPTPQAGVPVVFPGQCDATIGLSDFDLSRFVGTWHETEAYPKEEQSGQCISHAYTVAGTNQLNLVSSSVTDQVLALTTGTLNSTDSSGRLTITITSESGGVITIPFWIVATDYSNYALAYACVNTVVNDNPDFRAVWSWKLSRERQQSPAGNIAINNAIATIDVLDQRYYNNVDQSDDACFYLPEIAPGQPIILPGQCDQNIPVVQNFDVANFTGTWNQINSYFSESSTGTCARAEYSLGDGVVNVRNSHIIGQTLLTISGTATVASDDASAKLEVILNVGGINITQDLWILATDYNNYAISYTCENLANNQQRVYSWILSRTRQLSPASQEQVNQVVDSIRVLNNRYYTLTDQSANGCFFYPEPSDEPVIFRGQCDLSLPVMTDFDAAAYTGLWHSVEQYPAGNQTGSCSNAFYTLNPTGVVDVLNSEVIDQTLSTATATAVLVSDDGSAKLEVTFPIPGTGLFVTTDYWVMGTDYTSYALVYSCTNVDDDNMRVASWKLSRTKSLTPAANTAINQIVNQINVLDNRYYQDMDQSTEACFFYPTPQAGVPVVFPGQCDATIGLSDFDLSRFVGTWHETESYPKQEQTGQCISHAYTAAGTNQLNLVSSSVSNLDLAVTNGTLTATDSSGRLTITITSETGEVIIIPFWIVATDYTDYALAYSCVNTVVNDNPDFITVYSWKLSRTKTPTVTGTLAINNAMASINVLDDIYFEQVEQTYEACFYLPEFNANEPVTFSGQCDNNIPVVSNFNATRYSGRWRLIQTYYQESQTGTCNEANYELTGDSTIQVFNTQVINEELVTVTGSATAALDGSGKLTVTFPSTSSTSELWILDTDYNSYALAYSCENIGSDRRRVWSWKLSRTNTLTSAANEAIQTIVDSINVLNDRYYQNVQRSDEDCFYYPEPDVNTPVVFRGQCQTDIRVMPDFNATRYVDLWYDIESYPAPFQTGTCPTATYSLNDDGTVNLVNGQVENQLLETFNGTAVVVSDDGSAKLEVTINVNGNYVTQSLWVLDTDYDTYSIAYSCNPINDEYRAVSAWKLSRTPNLTPAANIAINNVINSIQVLDQRYFVPRSHTDQDCFYYPDNFGGDVILNGQCIASGDVLAKPDFDFDRFEATWYEVSRFPSGEETGECTTTNFVRNGPNAFTIDQVFVNNDRQRDSSIHVTLDDVDNRGVFTINGDGELSTNIYVLDTDYDEYALLYACSNIGPDQKRIYSWKLSRSQSGLSEDANVAIDEIVTENVDLWEGYYRVTGQDNNACFYYPEFESLPSSIVMPVPCVDNIRGVNNFNSTAYLGRWYETARYPTEDFKGTCNRIEYIGPNLEAPRIVISFTEVIEQALDTQLGIANQTEDSRAEFSVEVRVDGVPRIFDYYIAATDYDSYSLVYSCANFDNGTSLVSAWKRSRTPALSTEASAAIDNFIDNTRGIAEEYFVDTSQNEDDCFYIPERINTIAPRFRGRCQNVTGIEGFEINRYLGWWHEIERYPIDGNAGQCRSSWYTEGSGSAYAVVDSSVVGGNGIRNTGTAQITEDGRLIRNVAGREEEILVLATDYETYALLYSCVQEDEEYARVWSAIHSKTRDPISEEAKAIIAPIIAENRVLVESFYLPVDQSDSTCFHYPMIIDDADIVIDGQCDTDIPVVRTFDIDAFAGDWYHMESYSSPGENTCFGTRLTVEDNRNITVLNYRVQNDELAVDNGTATISSDNGDAKLVLTITAGSDINMLITPVYILATDYIEYALAYTCFNVNPFQRQVRAWKLSRERTLSNSGNAFINAVIRQRPELHQPYFKTITQSDDCAEPNSALLINSSIIMLLVCALIQRLL